MLMNYKRSIFTVLMIALGTGFALSDLRIETWQGLQGVFEWSETTLFGHIGKTWGAAFAVVEAFHLVGLALLGGTILFSDGRLLGLWFIDQSIATVEQQASRPFSAALALLIFTGVFMACGVAMKIYYLPVFWYKMLALFIGCAFVYGLRRPLLRTYAESHPGLNKLVAVASLMVWFTVTATGRWIGFSG